MKNSLNILMITHDRLEYLKKAVEGVQRQTFNDWKLIIWDNASGPKTRKWLSGLRDERITVYFNPTNDSLASVTTSIFVASRTQFVGKVDPDTIVPPDWAERLIHAHELHHFGFIGGFHFRPEDLNDISPNIENYNGVRIWRKHHIGGCAFIIRRKDFKGYAGIGVMGLSEYQERMGFVNGYLWDPILYVDHMEDARSEHYISNDEYRKYKMKTRGLTLERYQSSIINHSYMKENTL